MTWLRWFCGHSHRQLVRDGRVLTLVCERCGDVVPALTRDRAERAKMRRLQARLRRKPKDNVRPMRTVAR